MMLRQVNRLGYTFLSTSGVGPATSSSVCTSCRGEVDLNDTDRFRGGNPYCNKCRGVTISSGKWPDSEWTMEMYWDVGRVPPGVTRPASRSDE